MEKSKPKITRDVWSMGPGECSGSRPLCKIKETGKRNKSDRVDGQLEDEREDMGLVYSKEGKSKVWKYLWTGDGEGPTVIYEGVSTRVSSWIVILGHPMSFPRPGTLVSLYSELGTQTLDN